MDMWAVSAFWLLWTLLLWTWRCVSFYSFGFIPGSVIVGLYCNSIFNKDSNVSTSSPTLIFWFCFVNSNHPIKCEVTSLCGFDLHNDVKHHFMCCWQWFLRWVKWGITIQSCGGCQRKTWSWVLSQVWIFGVNFTNLREYLKCKSFLKPTWPTNTKC